MTHQPAPGLSAFSQRRAAILMVLALFPILLFAGTGPTGAAEPDAPDQCVACHTDAAKLKALTPPDQPAAESGEG